MFNRIKRFMSMPPTFDDDGRTYGAQLLHWILIVFTIAEIFAAPLLTRDGQVTPLVWAAILLNVLTLYVLHRRHFRTASVLFISVMWLIVTLSAVSGRGISTASIALYSPLVVLSAVLLAERGAIVITLITIFTLVVITFVQARGLVVFPLQAPIQPWAILGSHLILFLSMVTVVYFTTRRIRTTLERLQASERVLAEQNRQLEQQIMERQRVEAERDNLFQLSVDMMGIATLDGYFKRVNPAFERTLGYTDEEFCSRPFFDFIHPDDVPPTRQELKNLAMGKQQPVFENRYRRKDGEYRWFSWTTSPVDGYLYAVARDVTEQKQAEARERELRIAQEKAQFMVEFLSTVSHDLKTPLTVMDTSLYLLEHAQNPDKQRERIRQMRAQIGLVEKFIQDILTVSRLDYLPEIKREPVDINNLLVEIPKQLESKAETKQVAVQMNLTSELPVVYADADQLGRAFTNLIENALNYTPEGGHVTVRTYREQAEVVVEIMDTGIGILPEDLPHIFERFFRSDEARNLVKSGTGLGMAIVKKIMDMHRYSISIASRPGEGTTISVIIPAERYAAP